MCVNNHPVHPVIPGYGLFGFMRGFMCVCHLTLALYHPCSLQLARAFGGVCSAGCLCGGFGFGVWVCMCIWACWFGIRRNKAGGAGVAYGTWIRRTGRRVAVRWRRRRVLAGRAAPASPLAEGYRPPSQFPCHGDCLRRDSLTLFSTTLGSFITCAMVARNIRP